MIHVDNINCNVEKDLEVSFQNAIQYFSIYMIMGDDELSKNIKSHFRNLFSYSRHNKINEFDKCIEDIRDSINNGFIDIDSKNKIFLYHGSSMNIRELVYGLNERLCRIESFLEKENNNDNNFNINKICSNEFNTSDEIIEYDFGYVCDSKPTRIHWDNAIDKIKEHFTSNPDIEYTSRELCDEIGVGKKAQPTMNAKLKILFDDGFLDRQETGKRVFDNPVYKYSLKKYPN